MKRVLITLMGALATAAFAVGAEGPLHVDAASAASVHEWAARVEALESSGGQALRDFALVLRKEDTASGELAGAIHYLSPEEIRGDRGSLPRILSPRVFLEHQIRKSD